MKHLKRILAIKIVIYFFLILIILILLMQTTQYVLPETNISLENTTVLGRILGY
jgi:uncharacterized membrane protein YdbT with pleckstrin-like domain